MNGEVLALAIRRLRQRRKTSRRTVQQRGQLGKRCLSKFKTHRYEHVKPREVNYHRARLQDAGLLPAE